MGITYKNSGYTNINGTETSISAPALSTSVGDLIVVTVATDNNGRYCTGVSDTIGNTYVVRDYISGSTSNMLTMAYCLSSNGSHANNVVTASLAGTAWVSKIISVLLFTVDTGENVTFDVAASGSSNWQSSPWETGTVNTTGTDEVAVAGCMNGGYYSYSNSDIGGTSATEVTDVRGCTQFYAIFTSTLSNAKARTEPANTFSFGMEVCFFKSEAAGAALGAKVNGGLTICLKGLAVNP